ncbi:MAG TPA: tyrosine-type recombinase/integrase [Planctomycetota bacterium]|jgi:site-specific recombinase XerD
MKQTIPNVLAIALRDFFADYLPRLRGMSPHTVLSYRDTFALLLRFVAMTKSRPAYTLDLEDLGPSEVLAFLNHLEIGRHNAASTRNVRLAGLHAFFRYVASHYPDRLAHSQQVLGIPFKRSPTRQIEYFTFEEMGALLSGIDRSSKRGQRDYALLAVMFNTGARVQELLDLRPRDLRLTKPFQVRLFGKGRKERLCPVWPQTACLMRELCTANQLDMQSDTPVFANYRGEPLTRFGVRYILTKHLVRARTGAPTLTNKRLHPHSVRHSTAVHLLKSGVDLCTISHWLGHASLNTTNKYAKIDMEMKREAIARAKTLGAVKKKSAHWHRNTVLEWLEAL